MTEDPMQYGALVESALRSVVRDALRRAERDGLPGDHLFYLTCRTDHPGVQMPASLRASYPEEITLVLEHQFWDLEVREETFSITLSFGGKSEHLTVPFAALTAFVDPSVEFGLQFKVGAEAEGAPEAVQAPAELQEVESAAPAAAAPALAAGNDKAAAASGTAAGSDTVVELNTFRKKSVRKK